MSSIVRALLHAHIPADDSERDSLKRINDLVATSPAPFSRDHFVPGHLTASGIVVDSARENVLLIFHAKLKMWLQPGGHFEAGETDPSLGAAREVLEETGVVTRWPGEVPKLLDVDVHAIPARKNDPLHHHFDLRMLLIADKAEVKVGDDGVSDVKWVSKSGWQAMNLDPGLQRSLRKVFGK